MNPVLILGWAIHKNHSNSSLKLKRHIDRTTLKITLQVELLNARNDHLKQKATVTIITVGI